MQTVMQMLFFAAIAVMPIFSEAQPAYRGGSGDGYAMAAWPGIPAKIDEMKQQPVRYTNPVTLHTKLKVQFLTSLNPKSYTILTMQGKSVLHSNLSEQQNQVYISVNTLPPGTYLTQIVTKKRLIRFRFVKL